MGSMALRSKADKTISLTRAEIADLCSHGLDKARETVLHLGYSYNVKDDARFTELKLVDDMLKDGRLIVESKKPSSPTSPSHVAFSSNKFAPLSASMDQDDLLANMRSAIAEVLAEKLQPALDAALKDHLRHVNVKLTNLSEENKALNLRVAELERTINSNKVAVQVGPQVDMFQEFERRQAKQYNLTFMGVDKEDGENVLQKCNDIISEKLELQGEELASARRLTYAAVVSGENTGSRKGAPIIVVKCKSAEQKTKILRARRKLGEKKSGIFINYDLTPYQRQIVRELMPKCKEAREQGKRAAFIEHRLIIDGQEVSVQPPKGTQTVVA